MQDLLLAQKRDRPAYCFQHLDLELQSHGDGGRAKLCRRQRHACSLTPVVACFEPEWNSLDVNKTRSFNILGEIHDSFMHSFAAFAPGGQSLAVTPPCGARPHPA
jgi:hypothetical protein